MKIIEKEFTADKGAMKIRGKEIYDTDHAGKAKPVIISHGFTGDMSGAPYTYAQVLAREGYHTYIFDFCGGGYHTVSDGSFHDYMTPLTEIDDLKTVVTYVEKQEDIDLDSLVLFGCSQGGFVSALTASALKEKVHALILFYPALCIPDDARAGSMQRIRFDPDNIPPHIGEGRMRVCGAYASSVLHMNVFEEIAGFKGPVLLVHGTADEIVSYGYSLVADEIYRKHGAQPDLELIEGAPHGFGNEHLDIAAAILKQWIQTI